MESQQGQSIQSPETNAMQLKHHIMQLMAPDNDSGVPIYRWTELKQNEFEELVDTCTITMHLRIDVGEGVAITAKTVNGEMEKKIEYNDDGSWRAVPLTDFEDFLLDDFCRRVFAY